MTWQAATAVAGAIPCFLMAWRLFQVWRDPESVEQGGWVGCGIQIFVMEFLVVHAGTLVAAAMIGSRPGKDRILTLGFLALVYGFMTLGMTLDTKSRSLRKAFLINMGMRVATIMLAAGGSVLYFLFIQSAVSLALYFVVLMLGSFWLPRWGLADPKYAAALREDGQIGRWAEKPHLAIGSGAIYFTLLGAVELFVLSWHPLKN